MDVIRTSITVYDTKSVLNYLNSLNESLKFSCEHESSYSLPFLDFLVRRSGTSYIQYLVPLTYRH